MMVSAVKIDHVRKTFRNDQERIHVLEDFDLSIKQGEFLTIIGPSGCGKVPY